ncbi:MAG: bicyclomycin resistance protein [Methylibium sp.]|uniref:ABC transporter substrate-binding protein n=1 Tax=Methylibium sp. TaxID=2067992 RepID=UPI0017F99ABA|nr:ABC transporter substrate-binding protein [Methylibium sp.]MBA3597783.1 bicyclomycin resistance protein [Methylibium sp.]
MLRRGLELALSFLIALAGISSASSAVSAPAPAASDAPATTELKVLRYAFPVAESGFDPAQISDLYSRVIAANIFEAPLTYDYLSRPARVKPQTAAALPEVADDFTRFTFRIRPGIYFADDPAFKGQRRELVAEDYVYSLKRHYDPKFKSPNLFQFENAKILGLSELRAKVLEDGTPFPYDTPASGARTLDRYTFEIRLAEPAPRFAYVMADGGVMGAVAREVVEAHAGREMEHPVGTGPYVLADWRRSSRIVLERNPGYREHFYDEQAPADDARSQAIAAAFKGRRLPMIDRIEVAIVEEAQPRWLGFLNAEHDLLERLPAEFSSLAIPNNELAPNLARQGIVMDRAPLVDSMFSYFGMEHPLVGGYAPEKVALRRAISLAYNVQEELVVVRRSQAIPAQTIVPPLVSGYDTELKTEMSDFSRPRAKALLDLYGYVDRNGDGWREQPDGSALVLEYASQSDQASRQLQELWQKNMSAVGLRIEFRTAQWPENLKASRAGKLMIWGVAWGAASPDGSYFLDLMYGPNKGQANHARFDLPAFNALYERQLRLPDGPEREALMDRAELLGVAYMPYKISGHRIATDLMHPWVEGYRRHPFMRDFWRYIDIDNTARRAP